MSSLTLQTETDIEITCSCGNSLDSELKQHRGSKEIIVQKCSKCEELRDDEIQELADEIIKLSEQITKLEDEKSALEIQLTYSSLVTHAL